MNRWKGWFIVVTILLAICCAFIGVASFKLNDTRNQLAITQEQLSNTEVELNNLESQLIDIEDLLDTTQQQLVDTEAELSTTETQLNLTEAELNATETQLNNTETLLAVTSRQLETTVNENDQMLNEYANLRAQINVRFGNTTQDIQSFITPNNQTVQDKVQEITGGYSSDVNEYWRDCERLYRWVVNNISYSYDSYVPSLPLTLSGELNWFGECWRTPEETLEDETGDCEDMALLLASTLLSYNEGDYAIWLLTISSPDGAHMAVAFPVAGNELTILDPAGNYYTGWQYGTLSSEPIQTAANNWFSHCSSELPGAEIVQAFSDDFDEHFDSTDEFIAWASE
jgi:hypothetical protein